LDADHIDMNNTERSRWNRFGSDEDWSDIDIVEDVAHILIHLPHHTLGDESLFPHHAEISQIDEYKC
jgi:hypothetical protein